jgi:hypothetical protein
MMPDTLKVPFVDDDHGDVEIARSALERDGLDIKWRCVDTERSLRSALSEFAPRVVFCNYQGKFTASGGVALYPDDAGSFRSRRDRADIAMRESKNRASGHWRFYLNVLENKATCRLIPREPSAQIHAEQ